MTIKWKHASGIAPPHRLADLPPTWEIASLDELGTWFGGGTPSKDHAEYWNGGPVPWVSPKDMKVARILDTEDHITDQAVRNSATSRVPDGAVLMVTRSGILRHTFPVAVAGVDVTLNQDLKALVPFDGIDSEYVAAALRAFGDQVLSQCSKHGTTVQSIEFSRLKDFEIPIAPIPEQERIVAKVDELFSELDAGVASLKRAKALLKRYRQAVLKAAVTGELTRDWRENHLESPSGADTLVEIWEVRRRAANSSGWQLAKPRSLDPIYLWDIPDSWAWCSIDEAGDVQLGQQRAPQHHYGRHMRPYLRVANVLEDELDLADVKWMNFEPKELQKFELMSGDVLINEGQSPDLLGRSAVYNGEIEGCCVQKTLLRFRAFPNVSPRFAQIVFRSYMHSGRFRKISRITTNIGHLTRIRVVAMEFPIPPAPEQEEIVSRFEAIESNIKYLERLLVDLGDGPLRQSILKAAFAGTLVPQDEDDEPASVLLERIRAARAVRPKPARGRRRKAEAGAKRLELLG